MAGAAAQPGWTLAQRDRQRPALDRLRALKLRTLAVAIVALGCVNGGVEWVRTALDRWSAYFLGASAALPKPVLDDWDPNLDPHYAVPRAACTLLLGIAMYGYSTGRFGRLHPAIVFTPLVVCAVAAFLNRPGADGVGHAVSLWNAWSAGHVPSGPRQGLFAALVKGVLGAGLVLAAWPLLRLWNHMRRRVTLLQLELVTEAEAAPAAGASAKLGLPPSPPSFLAQLGDLRRQFRLGRVLFTVLALYLGFGVIPSLMGGWLMRTSGVSISESRAATQEALLENPPETARPWGRTSRPFGADAGPTPCALVGVWASSRAESVYQVTLQEDGRFTAVPLAQGRYDSTPITGQWSVQQDSLVWRYDGASARGVTDVNPVSVSSANSFTLREGNGELTRFNLIRRQPGSRCPA